MSNRKLAAALCVLAVVLLIAGLAWAGHLTGSGRDNYPNTQNGSDHDREETPDDSPIDPEFSFDPEQEA